MLKSQGSIVLHTRKEVISIFDELKNRINIAYESLTQQSFENLLTVLRVIYYLHPLPKFLSEINSIGSIPVTVFLQNLLIKTSMTKLKITKTLKNWIITLLLQFTQTLPDIKIDNIKELKTNKYQVLSEWSEDVIMSFVISDLQSAVKKRDVGIISIFVHFLRVFILHGEVAKQISVGKNDQKWRSLVQNTIEGTKMLDNLKREEISICICYYLCLKQKKLCHCALQNGVIEYLINTLNRQFISQSFGKKIIEFIKYLLLHIDNRYIEQISIPIFEKALTLFSSRFDKEELITSIRDLVSILEQKVSVINYEQKIENLSKIYDNIGSHSVVPQNLFEALHIINLYLNNDRMGNLIVKYYPSLFCKILHEQSNPHIIKMISSFLSFNFKKGKFSFEVAVQVISKVKQLTVDPASRQALLQNRKKILIDLVKIIKMVLQNRQHLLNVIQTVKNQDIQSKFWQHSDCTNFIYEKQLIELHRMMVGGGNIEIKQKELGILKQLQGEIINKSRFNLNKVSWELYEEVKFLQNLLNEEGKLQGYELSSEIPLVVSAYIRTTTHKATLTLLQNIQNQQSEQLRKQFNLVCCKLLTKLLKSKKISEFQPQVIAKMKALTTSKDEIDVIYDMINIFFMSQQKIQKQHEERQSVLRASMKMQRQMQQQVQLTNNVKSLLYQYFRNEGLFDLNQLDIKHHQDLSIFVQELGQYENQTDILKYLRVIYELTLKQPLCGYLFKLLSNKLFQIYQALLPRQDQNDQEIIMTIDLICLKFIKNHLKGLFNDQYDPDTVNYYLQYVGEIDNHFQYGFSETRIQLLELIIQYLECNMIESHHQYEKMIKKQNRSQFIREFIDQNRPEAIGLSYSKLLSFNSEDQIHVDFWMLHKEHIIRGLSQNTDNVSYLKFMQVYISQCERFIYKEYQLQSIIQSITELFTKECGNPLISQGSTGFLTLRKLKYFSLVLFSYVERDDLKSNRHLLYSQEEALVKCLTLLLESSHQIPAESFKKFYIEQILVVLLKTLTKLYRLNFIDKDIRSEQLSQYFDRFMEISNEDAINCTCELMRTYLLKKFASMAECPALQSCQQYLQSLPDAGQEHIKACLRIEELLAQGQDLTDELKYYFSASAQNDEESIDEDFEQFAKTMIENPQSQKKVKMIEPPIEQIPEQNPSNDPDFENERQVENHKEAQSQTIKKLEEAWTQFELLEYLKNIVKSASLYSIKRVVSRLQDLQNIEYYYLLADLFLDSQKYYEQDTAEAEISLEQVQKAMIEHIPGEICPLDSKYYEVLEKNLIGSDICLKKKGGMKATEILSKRLIQSTETNTIVHYMKNLTENIASANELKYLNNIKIEETVNGKIASFAQNQNNLRTVCDFIIITADNAQLKNHYDVSGFLANLIVETELERETKVCIIKTLTNLAKDCNKHKHISEKTKIVPYLVSILKEENPDAALVSPVADLLANIIDYSEALITKLYLPENLEELMLDLLQKVVKKDTYSPLIPSCLKIIYFLTKNPQSSALLLKRNFASLLHPLCQLSIKGNNPEPIGLEVSIVSHILDNSKHLEQVVVDLQVGGLTNFFVEAAHFIPKIKKTQIFLQIICKIFTIPEMIVRCMGGNKEILRILVDILKYTQIEMIIIEKWTKILVGLFEQSNFVFFPQILKTNIFFLATSCLKQNNFLTEITMDLNLRLMKELNNIEDPQNLLIRHGFAGYMIQILRMKNMQTNDYIALLAMLKKLQEKSIFPPHLSTKLFQIVIKNLEHHWNDELAVRSIILLKIIKKNVQITSEFSHSLFDFFNKFLIQCGKSNESFQFYSISREVICLVSYYINFNDDIKLLFRNQVMINLLKNWLKVFKSVVEDESHQTFRLWVYSVFNQQTLVHDVCAINNNKLSQIQTRFEKGWKVNLFRMDGSYKSAVLRFDRLKQQIVAFKYPDGEIKPKYRLPLNTILLIYLYLSEQDFLFKQSRFTRTINPFQHTVNHKHCFTLFSLIEERFQVRQISLQLQSLQELQEIYVSLKILINKMYERQREQEVKVWIARSSRQIPIDNFG